MNNLNAFCVERLLMSIFKKKKKVKYNKFIKTMIYLWLIK